MTPAHPGAIAIVQLLGDVAPILIALTGQARWPVGHVRLAPFDDIDEGLAGCVTETVAQLMPHGGMRVVQRVCERLTELGAQPVDIGHADPRSLFPEAADPFEALMLRAMAQAASPLAIDALLAQPPIWRADPTLNAEDEARSARLNRLIDPPLIILAGPANVGKSTLSNTLAGRTVSIAFDEPGTTRDYTSAMLDLAGLVVHWHDTPGLRQAGDEIESKAVAIARKLIERADLLIAMTDATNDWPELPREPDLRVASKADMAPRDDADLAVSAIRGEGTAELVRLVREQLVPTDDLRAANTRPWRFDPGLGAKR